jgi:flagellar basal body-associated protein FliL
MPIAQKNKAPPPSRSSAVVLVLAIGMVALGAWLWSTRSSSADRNQGGVPVSGGRPVKGSMHLETFVLNLVDREQKSYLRVGIDLGLGREIGRGENAPVGQVRDTILGVLAQARVDELLTAEGKTNLKADLLRALQERMPGLDVQEIYFTEFLIQR